MRTMSFLQVTIAPLMLFAISGCDALSYYSDDCTDVSECPGNACPGECVPLPPLGFDGPALLWMGSEVQAPECPARAPVKVYEGHSGLNNTFECPPCECSQPTCELPDGLTASNSNLCQGPQFTPLDAPTGWTGNCTAAPDVITSSQLRSVSINPATERPCEPTYPTVPHEVSPAEWDVFARACRGEAIDTVCNDPGKTCLPSAEPPPPGFRQCIMYLGFGEPQCPAEYPDRFEFYTDANDTRECTACECTQTAPAQCEVLFSTYEDANCSQVLLSTLIGPGMPSCSNIQLPSAELVSMSAEWVTNTPGSCAASGGTPVGELEPTDPRTFCCQSPPPSGGI